MCGDFCLVSPPKRKDVYEYGYKVYIYIESTNCTHKRGTALWPRTLGDDDYTRVDVCVFVCVRV